MMNARRFRPALVLLSGVVLLLGAVNPSNLAPAVRAPAAHAAELALGGTGGSAFTDVSPSHWAYRDICLMDAKGVFLGYSDGRFGPEEPVTRLQLVLLAVRSMGKELEARESTTPEEALSSLMAVFSDAASIPNWPGALECLAFAEENCYLDGFGHESGLGDVGYADEIPFRPNDPATRLDVVAALVDAMDNSAQGAYCHGYMTRPVIDAPDAGGIPEWARPHVALAMDLRLLRGDESGDLNLGDNVTRAQMAALLARTDDMVESAIDDLVIEGQVAGMAPGVQWSITVSALAEEFERYGASDSAGGWDGGSEDGFDGEDSGGTELGSTLTYVIAPSALVFRNGAAVSPSSVAPGDDVSLQLDDTGQTVILLDARSGGLSARPGLRATVDLYGYDPFLGSLDVLLDGIREAGYDTGYDDYYGGSGYGQDADDRIAASLVLSPEVRIWVDGEVAGDPDLDEGAKVILRFGTMGIADVYLVEGGSSGGEEEESWDDGLSGWGWVEGWVVDVSEDWITLTVFMLDPSGDLDPGIVEGEDFEFQLSADVEITDLEGQPMDWPDLEAGSYVSLTLEDGVVTGMQVLP